MRMIVMLMIAIVLAMFSGQALAAKRLEVTFTYNGVADGFTLWERTDGGKVEAVSGPGDARRMQWELADPGTDCRTYFLTAMHDGVESLPSNAVAWCPETQLPDMVVRPGQAVNLRIEVVAE